MYEDLINNVKNHFNQSKRTNVELYDKLHQLFKDNNADYEKFAKWYGKDHKPFNVTEKDRFEHYLIEDYKRSVYGESYDIKEYESIH